MTTQMLGQTGLLGSKQNQIRIPDETEGPLSSCLHAGEPDCSPWATMGLWKLSLLLSKKGGGSGQVAQSVRASSQSIKVAGSIPGQRRYQNQPIKASISGPMNRFLSL